MKKKKIILILFLLILGLGSKPIYAGVSDLPSPEAYYDIDMLHVEGKDLDYPNKSTLLFINSKPVKDYKFEIVDGTTMVASDLVSDLLRAEVKLDGSTIIISKGDIKLSLNLDSKQAKAGEKPIELLQAPVKKNDKVYLPLRFVSEELSYKVDYVHNSEDKPSLVDTFSNIIIDEKYEYDSELTVEKALEKSKKVCLEGHKNFSKNLLESSKNPDLKKDLDLIERAINNMTFKGEVSRFYMFNMDPYSVLYDRITDKLYFVIPSSGIIIEEVDVNSNSLYMPIFIVG